jgi:hypothetical protein
MSSAVDSSASAVPPQVASSSSIDAARWFYPGTAVLLLVLCFVGFNDFYLHGRAYPDRPIDPRIRLTVLAHGTVMTAWLFLMVFQPMLVALNRRKLHMRVGKIGAALAGAILILGTMTAIGSARTTPPQALIWGLPPKQFMAVPIISVWVFAALVALAVHYRRKPVRHRALMLFATMNAMSAGISRIDPLNDLYLGTVWERWFGPFFLTLVPGAVLLALRCAVIRRFDRWFALGFAIMFAVAVFIMNLAPTRAWASFASVLVD